MSLEDIEELSGPADGYSSALEKKIEEKWVKTAETMFLNDQINAYQNAQLEQQKARINAQAQQGGKPASAALINLQNEYNLNQENNAKVDNAFKVFESTKGSDASSFQALVGTGNIQNIEVNRGGLGFGNPKSLEITIKGAKEPIPVPIENAAEALKQILGVQQNMYNPGLQVANAADWYANYKQSSSPTKRSPFKQTDNGKKKVNAAEWLRKGQQYGRFKIGDENAKKYAWTNQGDDFIDPNTGERHRYDFLTEEGADEKSLGIGQRVRDAKAKADAAAAADYEAFIKERDEGYAGLGETVQANRARNIANSLAENKGLPKTEDIQAFIEGHRGRETGKAATPEELAAD